MKKDFWMFIVEMSVLFRMLFNISVNDLLLQFMLMKDNEYIYFYYVDDVRLVEDMCIIGIDLWVSKECDGMVLLLSFFLLGQCIIFDVVKKYYLELVLMDYF